MATAKALRRKINDEFLTCQICLNVYDDPTLLDCQHSFCRSCVEQCVQMVGGGLHCPVCRQRTLVQRKQGVQTLRKNFFIQSLIDSIGRRQTMEQNNEILQNSDGKFTRNRQQFCETCDDNQRAMKRCLDCCDFLCADCFLIHRHTKFTKGHKIVGISSLKAGKYTEEIQTRAKILCKFHDAEICKMFCEDCNQPSCQECMLNKCEHHSVVLIKVVICNAKSICQSALVNAEVEINNTYEWLNEIATAKRVRKRDKETISNLIEQSLNESIKMIKSNGKNLQEAAKAIISEKTSKLDVLENKGRKKLEKMKKEFEELKEENNNNVVTGSPEDLLVLREHAENLNNNLKAGDELGFVNPDWLDDECCVSLTKQGALTSGLLGKLKFKDYLISNSTKLCKYENLVINSSRTHPNIENIKEPEPSPSPPSYTKIKPKKMKKISTEESGSESPSMNLRRKLPAATINTDEEDFSSNETIDGAVFQDENTHAQDNSEFTNRSFDFDIATTSTEFDDVRKASVRRSKSLASLSEQIMGNRRPQIPPKPFPRSKNIAMNGKITPSAPPRPRSSGIDPHSFLRQPVRHKSTENLSTIFQRKTEAQGKCVIQYFDICGQTCRFTSAPKIAVLSNGCIIATDYKTQKVYRFSEDGVILNSFKVGSNGKDVHPIGLAITKKGKVVVTCGETVRILAPNGKSSRKFGNGIFGKSCGIACDYKTNKIVVSDIEKNCISIHSNDGVLEHVFSGSSGSYSSVSSFEENVTLHTPYFVAVDQRNGNIIASDWANHDIKIYDKDVSCLNCISRCFTEENGAEVGFLNPAGVCCDDEGNLFVADHGNHRIAMFSNNWEFQRFVATEQNNLRSPWSIAIPRQGKILVSEYWTKIVKVFSYS